MQHLARSMMLEGKYASQRCDDDRIAEMVCEYVDDDYNTRACFLAVTSDNEIVGFFAAELVLYPFRRGLCLQDVALYVLPAFRGSTAAVRLIARMQEWAEAHGADEIAVCISAPHDTTLAESVYERLGFTKWGTLMRKELTHGRA